MAEYKKVDAAFVGEGLGDALSTTVLVDVRPVEVFSAGHIPMAVNVPLDVAKFGAEPGKKFVEMCEEANAGPMMPIIVYGAEASDGEEAAQYLSDADFGNVMCYVGGFNEWSAAGHLPVEKNDNLQEDNAYPPTF